jgi:hypothetical protein
MYQCNCNESNHVKKTSKVLLTPQQHSNFLPTLVSMFLLAVKKSQETRYLNMLLV